MADTARTKSALAALLADNTTGQISPQDIRDFLETMQPAYGSCYVTASAATTIAVAGTYYKAAGTTTQIDVNRFTHANNRLTYTGTPTVRARAIAMLSVLTAGTNDVLGFKIAKNGTPIAASEIRRFVGTGTDVGAVALAVDVDLATNDYLEIWVTNEDATATVTLDKMYFAVQTNME